MIRTWQNGTYLISTDKEKIDLTTVHNFLTTSYWAAGVSIETVARSIEHSLVFGVYKGEQQVGFARLVTDYATFVYVADVFILEEFRGQGLAKWLMQVIVDHPELQGFRRWLLGTKDAHSLYSKVGFTPLGRPERFMEKLYPNVYK